jgi:hypothetical protein
LKRGLKIYRFLGFSSWLGGIFFCYWAFTDSRFRDLEGFWDSGFCLPFSAGVSLLIFGWAVQKQWRKSAFWFLLALIGQAVTLQMIEAGPYVRYQHYKTIQSLITETHPLLLIYLTIQSGCVFVGLMSRWSLIRAWLGRNLKIWQISGIFLVFFICSATVSRDISRYIIELFWASFIQAVNIGCLLLMVWNLPDEVMLSWKKRLDNIFTKNIKNKSDKKINLDRFAFGAALWVLFLTIIINLFSYERYPHVPDEALYLFQARYFANYLVTVPAPDVPEAFSFYLIPYKSANWYSIFPPGWPAILAFGVLLGVPWLINPILASLNVLLAYKLLQKIFTKKNAFIALFLIVTSPWYIFMGMNFMSHTFALTCALIASLALVNAERSGKTIWGLLCGVAVGILSLVRPLDGLILAVLVGLWSVFSVVRRRLKTSIVLSFIVGTVVSGAIILPYNMQITSHPARFPLTDYYKKYFGPKINALGFGPERGLGWAIDPFPGHSPIDAMVNANLNTFAINIELFGWSSGSLIIIIFLLFSRKMRKIDYLMFMIILALATTYSLYWFSGGPDFGARYWYLMLAPLIVLTVRGIQVLQDYFDFREVNSPVISRRVVVVVIALSLISLINFFPWRAIDKYHHYRGVRPDIREIAEKYDFGKGLILIRGDYSDYQSAWSCNPTDFKANAPIYAWDKNKSVRTRLLNAYTDRPVWIINGPSLTNTNFKVVEGPLTNQKLKAREQSAAYDLSFSTYFGGSDWEHARDVCADAQGNIYMVGGTASPDFPTTTGAYDTTFNPGYTGSFGPCDAFVSKFAPDGSLIWSTFLGGSGYDRAYAVEVDSSGYVYVAGRAGTGFPMKNAFQPTFNGVDNGSYGMQNAFVAKIKPDGSDLVWSSYVGVATLCRDLAIDNNGDVYVPGGRWNTTSTPPSEWFINAFQKTPPGGSSDSGVIKIKGDGSRVLWATWIGGSGYDSDAASIRVDDSGYVYIATCTSSDDIPTTTGAHDTSINGGVDLYVAKLTPDGSDLVYGTYIGDESDNWNNTHNLAIDSQGNAYISITTVSSNFPTTSGAFQTAVNGGVDWGVAKFSSTGSLISSTLIGGNSYDNPDGIYVDNDGNVFLTGQTQSTNFPGIGVSSYQSQNNGGSDAVLVMLSADFKELLYSTYMGGSSNDSGRSGFLDSNGNLYITGSSDGNGWPVKSAYQTSFNGGKLDNIISKLEYKKSNRSYLNDLQK